MMTNDDHQGTDDHGDNGDVDADGAYVDDERLPLNQPITTPIRQQHTLSRWNPISNIDDYFRDNSDSWTYEEYPRFTDGTITHAEMRAGPDAAPRPDEVARQEAHDDKRIMVAETEHHLLFRVPFPDLDESDVSVRVENHRIIIEGQPKESAVTEDQEADWPSRIIELPEHTGDEVSLVNCGEDALILAVAKAA